MFILHLCFDGNFVSNSCCVFEKYYPNQNLFLINQNFDKCKIVKDKEHFSFLTFEKENWPKILDLCIRYSVDKIVLHGLCRDFSSVLKYLCDKLKVEVYWLFWGYELYISLAQQGKYKLIDENLSPFSLLSYIVPGKYDLLIRKILRKQVFCDVLKDTVPYINYFCFWNYEDYKLLQSHYNTNIKYKFFAYSAAKKTTPDLSIETSMPVKKDKTILVNHQASLSGNHATLMKRLACLDKENLYTKIIPLSYGSKYIRRVILKKGVKMFSDKFQPILKYMPECDYFNMINQVEIAILGARRQEASGNIINLLSNGVKVFLREDNNLLRYYRDKGFIIFSYEKDLNSLDDLRPLSINDQIHNRECRMKNRIFYDQFMPSLF